MAKFVITEEQYNKLMEQTTDTLSLSNNPSSQNNKTEIKVPNNGDPGMAVNQTAKNLGNPKNVVYKVSGTKDTTNANGNNPGTASSTLESRIITKKELTENHFNHLRKNSKLYTVKDFLSK